MNNLSWQGNNNIHLCLLVICSEKEKKIIQEPYVGYGLGFFFFFFFSPCILALAWLPIRIWLTYCIEVIEGQSTHSNEKQHYKKLSTLAIGMNQFSLLRLQERV